MPLKLTNELIKEYADRKRNHSAYDITVQLYEKMRVHADGDVPEHIICERRPSEPEDIKAYRVKIYEPMTKSSIGRVVSSLSKIRRSTDWAVPFPEKKNSTIAQDETLEQYTTYNFPYNFTSLTNWLFGVCLKEYLVDSNAVVLDIPINITKDASDYYKPFPFIYNSPQVLDFVPGDYAVLLADRKCCYDVYDGNGKFFRTNADGFVLHYVDKDVFITYEQDSVDKKVRITTEFKHKLGILPAFKMPGIFFKACDFTFINNSRIDDMLPHLNEAARLYSDLQAEIVQHVHSEKWLYMNTSCSTCNGLGQVIIGDNKCECDRCHGIGRVATSPYANHVLTPPQTGEEAVPAPPAGYIQKTDVALMCDKINNLFKEQMYSALAAINMQFLDNTPLNQSGVAKEVDKDELNNFVYSVAEDLVYIMDMLMMITNEWRTYGLISDRNARKELLPKIPVPEKFDLLSSGYLISEVTEAKNNKVNPLIVSTLESEYAAKKFYNTPEIAQLVQLIYRLDPMPAISEEDKIMRLQNDGVTQIDYIISSNIAPFIKRAIIDDPKFWQLKYEEQMEVMRTYAQEKMDQNSTAGALRPNITREELVLEP